MKNKELFIIIPILFISSYFLGKYIADEMTKEVVNLNEYTEYYENGDNGGQELQQDNFYTFSKIYDLALSQENEQKQKDLPLEKSTYIVQNGDNFTKIASMHGLKVTTIQLANPKISSRHLKVGQKIIIFNQDGIYYTVKKGDSFDKIAGFFKVPSESIKKVNNIDKLIVGKEIFIKNPNLARYGKVISKRQRANERHRLGFRMPITYRGIASPFGNRFHPILRRYILHTGVDLRAKFVPVRASNSGTVSYAGRMRGYGKIIIIKHSGGYETRYAHLNKIGVKSGRKVNRGELIGQSGQSGRVTGPHLHFELRRNGRILNPMKYVRK